jgi:hypothetical protein
MWDPIEVAMAIAFGLFVIFDGEFEERPHLYCESFDFCSHPEVLNDGCQESRFTQFGQRLADMFLMLPHQAPCQLQFFFIYFIPGQMHTKEYLCALLMQIVE